MIKKLFSLPELLNLDGSPFDNDILATTGGKGCGQGCENGCADGCATGSGSGSKADDPIK